MQHSSCSQAEELLACYTKAIHFFYASQVPILAGMLPDHPLYGEVQEMNEHAFTCLLKVRRLYWAHTRDHGRRRRG